MPGVLVIGYGNPGRGDDGLGPALAERVAALDLPGVTVERDYQLTVDHAAMIAAHDRVVFADAMIGLGEPCRLTPVSAVPVAMGSHQISPEAALHLAGLLFGHAPPGFILAIRGEEFGQMHEGLSPRAEANLVRAVGMLCDWLDRG